MTPNDGYADTSALQRRSRLLIKSLEHAEAIGDTQVQAEIRREAGDIHSQLQGQLDIIRATEAIKQSHRTRRSLFAASAGAASHP